MLLYICQFKKPEKPRFNDELIMGKSSLFVLSNAPILPEFLLVISFAADIAK